MPERFVADDADEALVFAHVWVDSAIVCFAVVSFAWPLAPPLPPWSERLAARDRGGAHRTEQPAYELPFMIPGKGLALLLLHGQQPQPPCNRFLRSCRIHDVGRVRRHRRGQALDTGR